MNSSPPEQALVARLSPVWRVELGAAGQKPETTKTPEKNGPAAQAADEQIAETKAHQRESLVPGELLVRIDSDAGRFVHTLKDGVTNEVLWSFPSETQLAYARAVRAYMRASASG
jgi:hypothetical protein